MPLHWEPEGKAAGQVVLLHDLGSHAGSWARVGPRLANQGWVVEALDLAGHGSMPRLTRPLDIAQLVDGVVDSIPRHVDLLIGHGFGAIVALTVAGHYGAIASAIVAEDPPSGGTSAREALARELTTASPLAHSDPHRLAEKLSNANPGWSPEDVRLAVEGLSKTDVPPVVSGLRNRIAWDLPGLVAMLRVPLLVLAAPDDPMMSMPYGRSALVGSERKEVRNLVPSTQFVELGGGHALHRDVRELWLSEVSAFARRTLSRPRS